MGDLTKLLCFAIAKNKTEIKIKIKCSQGIGVCRRIGGKLPEPRSQKEINQLVSIMGNLKKNITAGLGKQLRAVEKWKSRISGGSGTRLGFKQAGGGKYKWNSDGSEVEKYGLTKIKGHTFFGIWFVWPFIECSRSVGAGHNQGCGRLLKNGGGRFVRWLLLCFLSCKRQVRGKLVDFPWPSHLAGWSAEGAGCPSLASSASKESAELLFPRMKQKNVMRVTYL